VYTFPFGAPVKSLATGVPAPAVSAFVLGAYPSALHVEWRTPDGRRVAALPVDNEPYPFWDGSGMDEFFGRWHSEYFRPQWGTVTPSRMNGSSGRKLYAEWIAPLGIEHNDYFVTDCLDTAMMSTGVERRVTAAGGTKATYHVLVNELGLPPAHMPMHPSERTIVELAREHHGRLRRQLEGSRATIVITLGNAAARVVAALGGQSGGSLEQRTYRDVRTVTIGDRSFKWHALVHPAVRPPWTGIHRDWRVSRGSGSGVEQGGKVPLER
jgi:hypothetical protein